jgi:hypothetical protein
MQSLNKILVATLLLGACGEPLDTTRRPIDDGTFGETVYTLTCQRLAYTLDREDGDGVVDVSGDRYRALCREGGLVPDGTPPAVEALADRRAPLVAALDVGFPADNLGEIQGYVTSNAFLSLYDEGIAETAASTTGALFDEMAGDDDLVEALARLDWRPGHRPYPARLGTVRETLRYPRLSAVLVDTTGAIVDGGPARDAWLALQRALSHELTAAAPAADPAAPDRTLRLAVDLLLEESSFFGVGSPMPLVRRDHRGVPLVRLEGGVIPAPFVDADTDGLADVDLEGRLVYAGSLAPTPFPGVELVETAAARDSLGRALAGDGGASIYDYVDLDRTLLGALARDTRELVNPTRGTAFDLLRGASALLGRRESVTDGDLTYLGYDTTESALLDLLHGFLSLLTYSGMDEVLGLSRQLLIDHPPEAARLIESLIDAADLGDRHPEAQLEPDAPLYDDLVPVINQILAVPGLAEDLMRALQDPRTRQLAQRFADMMEFKDRIDLDGDQNLVGTLRTPVDRAATDSGYNRSVMQRVLHLIHDANGVPLCSKAGASIKFIGFSVKTYDNPCELMRVDDMAVLYLQSIAYLKDVNGNVVYDDRGLPVPKAHLEMDLGWLESLISDDTMESQAGIDGFRRHPTPQALNRVLFLDPPAEFIANAMDPAVCGDGDRFIDQHQATLMAFELNGFYDQLRPIVQAFADHDAETLFVQVMAVLHQHYPSRRSLQHQHLNPQNHGYARRSNAVSYEPYLVELIGTHDLWPALTETSTVVNGVTAPTGRRSPEVLVDFARFLFRHDNALTDRSGDSTTTTDDGRPIAALSPWYILADAVKLRRAQVASAGAEGALWNEATGELVDLLVRGEQVSGTWRFRNPRFRGTSIALIDFLRARLAAHRTAGDLTLWARRELVEDAEEMLASPVFAGAADFLLALSAAPAARTALEDLLMYLTSEGNVGVFVTGLTMAADVLQLYLDDEDLVPITRFAGRALDPARGLVDAHLDFLHRAGIADESDVLTRLLANLAAESGEERTAMSQIVDAIIAVHRARPLADAGAPLGADDYRSLFRALGGFFGDEKRGLRKFVRIVENRHL